MIISVLLTSSVLILVILLLRWMLRGKVGNVFLYALWLVVAVRLILPVPEFFLEKAAGIEKPRGGSSVSVMNLAAGLASHWENDTAGQGEEPSSGEPEKLSGENAQDVSLEMLEKEEAGSMADTQGRGAENTGTAQTHEADSRELEMPEDTADSHMYEKTRKGGGSINFPQSPWPA